MKYILCYGDSNTWGCVPEKFTRYDFTDRWPGIMQGLLGEGYHIYENALNGRTTVFEDPIEEGRNGRTNFEVSLMQTAPLDLVILMLGTNDVKNRFLKEPWDIAWGMDLLVSCIQKSGAGRDGNSPQILIASPIHMSGQWGNSLHHTVLSTRSVEKIRELAEPYQIIAERNCCGFIDTALYGKASIDGVHMSKSSHRTVAEAMAMKVKEMLG